MSQIDDLMNLHLDLQKKRFYGTIIEIWQDGEVKTVKIEQIFKEKDFHQILVEVRSNI